MALENLGVPHKIVMASDTSASVKKLAEQNFQIACWFDDMTKVPVAKMPGNLDLYSCGFPCQPYSTGGKNLGLGDDRATPLVVVLDYIRQHQPGMVLLENVAGFLRAPHKEAFESTMKGLRSSGTYHVHHQILNTRDHGVAQQRRRLYIVGIKKSLTKTPFKWPAADSAAPFLSKCYDRDRCGVVIKNAEICPDIKATETKANALCKAFKAIRKMGETPKEIDAIVDIGASLRFATCQVGYAPTLTRTRCASHGYYATRLMRCLTTSEMMRLQGVAPKRLQTKGIAYTQMGAIIGNAMSVNVVQRILDEMLKSIGWY